MELIRGQDSDGTREKIVSDFYDRYIEDDRLERSIHGRLEYATTMHYIHRFAGANAKVLEVVAGTGRYSIALAKEGMNVSSIELVQSNYERLKKNCEGIESIEAFQGDATDLGRFADSSFDLTLVFGPMYHLYEKEGLFKGKEVDWITTTGVDGLIEPIEDRSDFSISDKDFEALSKWYLAFSEKRELLGNTNHLLYICKKNNMLGGRYEN